MRHYDRAGFRHLDDAERYRDYEYLGDDGWVGPNEHATSAGKEGLPSGQMAGRVALTSERGPFTSRPFPAYGQSPAKPSFEGRGPRREPPREPPREASGFVQALLHPRQAVQRAVHGLFTGRGPKNWTRSDARIHDDVCERLAHHRDVDATDIELKVDGGEVTLTGTVVTRFMKYAAEDAVAEVMGVHDVHNRLRIPPRQPR